MSLDCIMIEIARSPEVARELCNERTNNNVGLHQNGL